MAFVGMENWKKHSIPQDKPFSKYCKRCKKEKVLEDFYKKREAIDGRNSICKNCDDARVAEYQKRKKAERDLYGFI